MEWIERHPVMTSLAVLTIGWVIQALYTRWKVTALTDWQKGVDTKLQSIDNEINQIKISDAREGLRIETLKEDMTELKGELKDIRDMLVMVLSGEKLEDKYKK